jgi:hypothetical protein
MPSRSAEHWEEKAAQAAADAEKMTNPADHAPVVPRDRGAVPVYRRAEAPIGRRGRKEGRMMFNCRP